MPQELTATERVFPQADSSPTKGRVVWAPAKSLWYTGMLCGGLVGVLLFPSWEAALVTLGLLILTLCVGHSVGMHRLLIHRSFVTPTWLEYVLVYLGTLVGMAGPIGMFKIHEIRDWQQQQEDCHSFAKHDVGFWRDAIWQMHCEQNLDHPPELKIESRVTHDRFYQWLEKTWRWQQIPLAIVLYLFGGLGFVLWGICLRVALSLTGHWCTVHFAHTVGQRPFVQNDIAVDGRNLPAWGLFTFGEAFHNNHHAFPRSSRMGFTKNQVDPGWWFIVILAWVGWAKEIKVPNLDETGSADPKNGVVDVTNRYQIFKSENLKPFRYFSAPNQGG